MPQVHVTQNPTAVIAIVALIGVIVVVALLFSFLGSRIPKRPPE